MQGFATARQKMVDGQVRPGDVTDIRLLDAMLAVPREAFVPQNQRALAYLDLDLDVSEQSVAKRFLIRPLVIAKMLQAVDIKDSDKVLVVGSATGYAAAVVAHLAKQVVAIEADPLQAARAKEILLQLGLGNVTFRVGAAADGDQVDAPYDAIVLNGATEITPSRLYGQLTDGGRLVGVFAITKPPRAMIATRSHDDFGSRVLFDASVPVLPGFGQIPAFVF